MNIKQSASFISVVFIKQYFTTKEFNDTAPLLRNSSRKEIYITSIPIPFNLTIPYIKKHILPPVSREQKSTCFIYLIRTRRLF